MASVRYVWMFRTAAVVYLLMGLSVVWRYGFTAYDPQHRIWGIGLGALAILIGIFLFKPARLAIGLSGIGAALIAIAAAVAAPIMHGPVILALGLFALLVAGYAALAAR